MTPCSWCGFRTSITPLFGRVPTCETCRAGGRQMRVWAYLQRLRRAAEDARSP